MIFWVVIVAVSAAAALALGLAFRRGAASGSPLDVYRDQLAEIDRDLARGVIAPDEAERVRVEVSRRLLEADRAAEAVPEGRGPGRVAGLATGLVVVLMAVAGYAWLGQPGYRDLPLSLRLQLAEEASHNRPRQEEAEALYGVPWMPPAEADAGYLDLVRQLREKAGQRPDDLQGQVLLASNEARLGNYAAAWKAQAQVVRLKGAEVTANDLTTQASLMILAAGNFVSPEAEAVLTRALTLDHDDPVARYYTGLLFAQTDRPDLAFRMWRPLLDAGPPDAPWIAPIRAQIQEAAARAGIRYQLPAEAPGPSADDVAAAGQMSEADRGEMIRGMVDRLSERLATEGGPASDWARLITALGVLGETDRARAIYGEAQATFAADPAGLDAVRAAAKGAGIAE